MRVATRDRLIVALDVPDTDSAKTLVAQLDDSVLFYKIGLELAMSGHYFELMRWLLDQGKHVFADLKFHDIPATVGRAVRQLSDCGASFLTVHAEPGVVEAAAEHKGPDLKILAVTVLTSIGQKDLERSGISMSVQALSLMRATRAVEAGCDGVIASGLEARELRNTLGAQPYIVTPGIRTAQGGRADQQRIVTPKQAFEAGASHIVVGRPIRDAAKPYDMADAIQLEIANAFE